MDIQSLRAFAAVASEGSFSRAAERLHLTQPAISKRIANLELGLETPLFDRLGRQVALTEAGRALLARIPDVEQSLHQAEVAVRELNGEPAGHLRIATSHHIGLHRLPPILSEYKRHHAGVHLDIEFLDSEQAYERLRVGAIELGIVTLAPGDVSKLRSEALWEDPLSVMVAHNHPLSSEKQVTLRQLSEHPAVLPGLDTFTGRIVQGHFEAQGESLYVGMATNYLETLRMMASVGLGWTVLPTTMLTSDLIDLPLKGGQLSRTLGLVYHQNRRLSRSASTFVDMLQACRDT